MMDDGTIPASRPAAAPKVPMIALHVPDMTCGHCVGTVTKAVQDVDRAAQIRIDLDSHRVEIEPTSARAPSNSSKRFAKPATRRSSCDVRCWLTRAATERESATGGIRRCSRLAVGARSVRSVGR